MRLLWGGGELTEKILNQKSIMSTMEQKQNLPRFQWQYELVWSNTFCTEMRELPPPPPTHTHTFQDDVLQQLTISQLGSFLFPPPHRQNFFEKLVKIL